MRFAALRDFELRLPPPYEAGARQRHADRQHFIREEVATLSLTTRILIGADELCKP